MRIAIVCPYAWDRPGGVQSHIRSLAPVLRARGHDVRVCAASFSGRGGQGDAGAEVIFAGRAVAIPANGSVAPICFGPAAAYRVRDELARFAPDVMHLHEPLIPSLSLLALLTAGVPAVGTFHAAAPSSLLYQLAKPALTPLYQRLAAKTAVSFAAAALVGRYFPGEVELTPNGIDVAAFAQTPPADLGPGRHVLFLGRLEPRKGADIAVRAMVPLKSLDARLLVAGEGRMRPALQDLANRLGVDVRFLGAVSDEDKAQLLRSCDVYCAPNLAGESFGIVLVEAMAGGCPVVCSDLDAFRAVAGEAAFYFPPGDSAALAKVLSSVLSAPERGRTKAALGRQCAAAFDWSRLVTGLEKILEQASLRR